MNETHVSCVSKMPIQPVSEVPVQRISETPTQPINETAIPNRAFLPNPHTAPEYAPPEMVEEKTGHRVITAEIDGVNYRAEMY